jgi:hypothetical protein
MATNLTVLLCSILLQAGKPGASPYNALAWQKQLQAAGDDPVQLLRLLPAAGEKNGPTLRRRIHDVLNSRRHSAGPEERARLAQAVAQVLPKLVHSQQDVNELLGDEKEVSRQLLYQRYREQWRYRQPLPLTLVFDCRKGKAPVLVKVQSENPP